MVPWIPDKVPSHSGEFRELLKGLGNTACTVAMRAFVRDRAVVPMSVPVAAPPGVPFFTL